MNIKKTTAVFCAALCLVCLGGCSDKENSSGESSVQDSQLESSYETANESSEGDSSSLSTQEDSSGQDDSSESGDENTLGEGLQKAYEILSGDSYSMKVTYKNNEGDVEIYRVKNNNDFYQLQEDRVGKGGIISVDGVCYDFDYVCGIYKEGSPDEFQTVIENVVQMNLPRTQTHINEEDAQNYAVEEYTYTGDTYITTIDFYFDKDTLDLVKYTSFYSVEGEDDLEETREITLLSEQADETVFDISQVENLINFNEMTEEKREGYCQGICLAAGITQEDMTLYGITQEEFQNISYEDFVDFVHSYGYKN